MPNIFLSWSNLITFDGSSGFGLHGCFFFWVKCFPLASTKKRNQINFGSSCVRQMILISSKIAKLQENKKKDRRTVAKGGRSKYYHRSYENFKYFNVKNLPDDFKSSAFHTPI